MQSFSNTKSYSLVGDGESREQPLFRNDWSTLVPPERWQPRLAITVVVATTPTMPLDRCLRALTDQSYPAELTEVVVAPTADGPAHLPAHHPPHCRMLPPRGDLATARADGAAAARADLLCWLDADHVPTRHHLRSHAQWLHHHGAAVTLGRIHDRGARPAHPAQARILRRTRLLRHADHLGFEAFVLQASALHRALYRQVGGLDPQWGEVQGRDLGYRLWQAGAVLIPASAATARRHADPPRRPAPARVSPAALPHPRSLRRPRALPASIPRIPLLQAAIRLAAAPDPAAGPCADHLLAGAEHDLHLALVAPWHRPTLDLSLLQARYVADPRVAFRAAPPMTGYPAPYLLEVRPRWGVAPHTVGRLLARADRAQAGLVELSVPGHGVVLRLWRTRALCRALRVRRPGQSRADAVAMVHGRYRVQAGPADVVDLHRPDAPRLPDAAPAPAPARLPPLGPPAARRGGVRQLLRSAMRRSTARSPSS